MRFLSAAHTDIGIAKKINQDSFTLKIAKSSKHNIAFAVLCDGMGGLKNGELASAFVVNAFSNWFEQVFPSIVDSKLDFEAIKKQWNNIAISQCEKIMDYGNANGISLGTTLSAILCIDNQYIIIHIGDTRIYRLNDNIEQITTDHTFVANEVLHNRMTVDQAQTDSRKNVLLQCIGASKNIECEFKMGTIGENEEFLLCCDGFRHEISNEEIYGVLAPDFMSSEKVMRKSLVDLVNLNKQRNEKDNITAILIKTIY
ncbi:MAG: serine/threonine-protein phosphatase [Eubacterium sp.]|nr:serine/threonine-protein phosphatase [Eubacterium sp.]